MEPIPKVFQKWGFGFVGFAANFFVWSERPLCYTKARVKTKNLLQSQRSQIPIFQTLSVYAEREIHEWYGQICIKNM